jgi:hypothetical protein
MSTTIEGHPHAIGINPENGQESRITLCSECGELRTILWLTGDRWYCHTCRNSGVANSKVVPIHNPARRR